MTIDRLSSLSAHIAALRAEMSKKKGETRNKSRTEDVVEPSSLLIGKRESGALRKELVDVVRGVSIDDSDELDHARKRVVKVVLLWEFGRDLREHSEWQPMVETVADAIAADERFRNSFNRLVMDLQST